MSAPIGTIPLPFDIFKQPQNADLELWNREMPHLYALHYPLPSVRNAILQKWWWLACGVQKADAQSAVSLIPLKEDITALYMRLVWCGKQRLCNVGIARAPWCPPCGQHCCTSLACNTLLIHTGYMNATNCLHLCHRHIPLHRPNSQKADPHRFFSTPSPTTPSPAARATPPGSTDPNVPCMHGSRLGQDHGATIKPISAACCAD